MGNGTKRHVVIIAIRSFFQRTKLVMIIDDDLFSTGLGGDHVQKFCF
jgi:hypothetical protein